MNKRIYTYIRRKFLEIREKLFFIFLNKNEYILVNGYPESTNLGDALNIPIVEYLSEKKVLFAKYINLRRFNSNESYSVIGSILQWAPKESNVWGSGFISDKYDVESSLSVFAVRGPKTRDLLINNNIACPEVYGDPALLLSLIYPPKTNEKKYKYGIIPHYVDKSHEWINKVSINDQFTIIDLEVGTNYKMVVDQMLECETIYTSSLHGLIIAYAYKIPVCRIKFSDKVEGGNFKFDDFYLSINKEPKNAVSIRLETNIELLNSNIDYEEMQFDLKPLILSCPFITNSKKQSLLNACI